MGLYLSAIALSQDSSLRKSIKKSAVNLIGDIGSAQMEKQIEKRVTKLISDQQKELEEQTGGFSDEVTEKETKDYVELVLNEKKRLSTAD
jgi:ATP-dependent Lon protease